MADGAREQTRGTWADPIDVSSERATTVDHTWVVDSEPVGEPPFVGKVTAPNVPATQRREQLPALVSGSAPVPVLIPARGLPAVRPKGGHWPVWCIALAIQLVTRVKLSLRSTPKALDAVLSFLRGRMVPTILMAGTTVRCWLMRLGLYALRRPLEPADDWAYLTDHTVQIGTVKCFAVVGVRLSQLPYPQRCLQREDLVLIALVPMPQSNAVTVKQALEEAALRTGIPRLIVSDEGGDVRGGIEQYCEKHPHTSSICDMAHKGANLLRKLLEGDARWPGFVAHLGQTRAKLQQTTLACCVGPALRPKARFMNLGAPLRWARWCLRVLDGPWPASTVLSDRQRAVLANIDREQLEAKLGWLRDYREAIAQWSEWHEVIQVVVRQVRRCGIGMDSVATLEQRLEALKLSPSGRDVANQMLIFVRLHATAVHRPDELLIASTEILESLFGELKTLERQQAGSGLTGLILAMGAIVSTWTDEEITQALEATPWKAVQTWIDEHLGPTVQSQRRTLQAIFADT